MNFLPSFSGGLAARSGSTVARCLVALLGLTSLSAHADLAAVREILVQRAQANHEPFNPSSVTATLITGLYRWERGANVGQVYVNEAVTLMLVTDSKKITRWDHASPAPQPIGDAEKGELLSEMIKNIEFDKLIHFNQGNRNKVLLISAYDCQFCSRFERMLAAAGTDLNTDVYVLPSTLRPDLVPNVSTVSNIWCSPENSVAWRETVSKGAKGYFVVPASGCQFSIRKTEDIEVILRSAVAFKGYPYMIFGNGESSTPSSDPAGFSLQLKRMSGAGFWAQPDPRKYAHFRASGPVDGGTQRQLRTLKDLFKRGDRSTN